MTVLAAALEALVVDPVILGFIDRHLLDVHAGQALIGLFVLVMLLALPLKSAKVLAINVILFGIIFLVTPFWVIDTYEPYIIAGIAMIFIGTMWFAFADS